jgi:hypothetical protein
MSHMVVIPKQVIGDESGGDHHDGEKGPEVWRLDRRKEAGLLAPNGSCLVFHARNRAPVRNHRKGSRSFGMFGAKCGLAASTSWMRCRSRRGESIVQGSKNRIWLMLSINWPTISTVIPREPWCSSHPAPVSHD